MHWNPFTYQPSGLDPDEDWDDNWLSNSMAWASKAAWPSGCATPDHWSSRLTNLLWTTCACCLVIRGFTVGLAVGVATHLIF